MVDKEKKTRDEGEIEAEGGAAAHYEPPAKTGSGTATAAVEGPPYAEKDVATDIKKTAGGWAQDLGIKRGVAGACKLRGWSRDTLVTEREFLRAVNDYLGRPVNAGAPGNAVKPPVLPAGGK